MQVSNGCVLRVRKCFSHTGRVCVNAWVHAKPRASRAAAITPRLPAGPLEMAKNRVQAGLVAEPLLQYTLSGRGLRDTLPLMGPFMLASVPHDFAELMLYFQGHKILEKTPESSWPRCCIPLELSDAVLGACAGTCAVVLSMPADCLKTKVLTNYGAGGALGPCGGGAGSGWRGRGPVPQGTPL